MKSTMLFQYELVLEERNILLNYCSIIPTVDFIRANPVFGNGGSMKSLLVHICNTYCGWLAEFVGKTYLKKNDDDVEDLFGCRQYFDYTNELVLSFIKKFEHIPFQLVQVEQQGKILNVTPLELFTHTFTHEFHHKGQILSLSRSFGYVPVDTDIIR